MAFSKLYDVTDVVQSEYFDILYVFVCMHIAHIVCHVCNLSVNLIFFPIIGDQSFKNGGEYYSIVRNKPDNRCI